jgi:hypothetical protein
MDSFTGRLTGQGENTAFLRNAGKHSRSDATSSSYTRRSGSSVAHLRKAQLAKEWRLKPGSMTVIFESCANIGALNKDLME